MTRVENTSLERVSEICVQALGLAKLSPDDDLFDMGCDSVKAVVIALEVEKAFSMPIPAEILFDRNTPRALAAWIEEERALFA